MDHTTNWYRVLIVYYFHNYKRLLMVGLNHILHNLDKLYLNCSELTCLVYWRLEVWNLQNREISEISNSSSPFVNGTEHRRCECRIVFPRLFCSAKKAEMDSSATKNLFGFLSRRPSNCVTGLVGIRTRGPHLARVMLYRWATSPCPASLGINHEKVSGRE